MTCHGEIKLNFNQYHLVPQEEEENVRKILVEETQKQPIERKATLWKIKRRSFMLQHQANVSNVLQQFLLNIVIILFEDALLYTKFISSHAVHTKNFLGENFTLLLQKLIFELISQMNHPSKYHQNNFIPFNGLRIFLITQRDHPKMLKRCYQNRLSQILFI